MVKKIFIIFYRLTVHKIPVGMFIKILMEENVRSYRYDCVVIGGGASGMMAAVTGAQKRGKKRTQPSHNRTYKKTWKQDFIYR